MPVFTVAIPMGRLDQGDKHRIAVGITAIHTEETGAPDSAVCVLFHAYPQGAAWSSSHPSAPAIVQASIRTESSDSVRSQVSYRISTLLTEVLGTSVSEVLVNIDN